MTTLETVFDELAQDEEWRNQIAIDLNLMLARARYFLETSNDQSDQEAAAATVRVVERVREFEEIKTIEQLLLPGRPNRKLK